MRVEDVINHNAMKTATQRLVSFPYLFVIGSWKSGQAIESDWNSNLLTNMNQLNVKEKLKEEMYFIPKIIY